MLEMCYLFFVLSYLHISFFSLLFTLFEGFSYSHSFIFSYIVQIILYLFFFRFLLFNIMTPQEEQSARNRHDEKHNKDLIH